MKQKLNNLINFILLIFLGYALSQRIPEWYQLYQLNNQEVSSFSVYSKNNLIVDVPIQSQKGIYVFWATWCGPCSIELARIQKAIDNKDFPKEYIHAISLGENPEFVFTETNKRNYTFNVYADTAGNHAKSFKVFATPTVYFVTEKGTITKSLTGLSPLLTSQIKDFLKN